MVYQVKCSYHKTFLDKENGKLPYFKMRKDVNKDKKVKYLLDMEK